MKTNGTAQHPDGIRLSEYLDDDLALRDRAAIEAHVSTCDVCGTNLLELRRVADQARGLALPSEPDTDLWPGIQSRLSRPRAVVATDRGGLWRWPFGGQPSTRAVLAAAATLVIASAATVAWLVSGPRNPTAAPGSTAGPTVATSAGLSDRQYEEALAALRRAVHGRLTGDPRVLDVIEENLAVIDISIAEYREALALAPGDADLGSRLDAARQRKLAVLRQAATLAPEGAD